MIPLVDIHCHLLAGVDDGPQTQEEALEMCRIACTEGTSLASATAHQSEHWPANTPELIRQATKKLAAALATEGIPLSVFPCAEVVLHPELEAAWRRKELLSLADRGEYLLIEMPEGLYLDPRHIVRALRGAGVRPILAHAERYPELLDDTGAVEELVMAGCLVQVSARALAEPESRATERTLKSWLKRGVIHFIGSDGHSPQRRPPKMAGAYHRITHLAGSSIADRVCSTNGMAVLQGLPLRVSRPEPARRRWFSLFWH